MPSPASLPACSTNSSYDRWWEARKLWGGVVNRSRDIVRQVGAVGWASMQLVIARSCKAAVDQRQGTALTSTGLSTECWCRAW